MVFDVHEAGPVDGTPVLLLHGFPQSARSWRRVVGMLRAADRDLRLVAPDQRGYSPGARPAEVAAYRTATLAADVLGVADALGLERVHLVGHDWGAAVAWTVAAHHPERLASLTALSIPHLAAFGRAIAEDPEQQALSSYIGVFRREGAEELLLADDARRLRAMYAGQVDADDVEAYVALMAGGAAAPALHWYRAMGRDLRDLPAVRVPTTYVWGEEDQATARASAQWCADHVDADYRFVALPGAGHWTPDQQPDVVAREVLARVRGVAAPPA
nr:alpha/beta hydrolase [Nocardioides perillae]